MKNTDIVKEQQQLLKEVDFLAKQFTQNERKKRFIKDYKICE